MQSKLFTILLVGSLIMAIALIHRGLLLQEDEGTPVISFRDEPKSSVPADVDDSHIQDTSSLTYGTIASAPSISGLETLFLERFHFLGLIEVEITDEPVKECVMIIKEGDHIIYSKPVPLISKPITVEFERGTRP